MPTRISADVGDHPCFLTFYNYDPYRLILNFPYTCTILQAFTKLYTLPIH